MFIKTHYETIVWIVCLAALFIILAIGLMIHKLSYSVFVQSFITAAWVSLVLISIMMVVGNKYFDYNNGGFWPFIFFSVIAIIALLLGLGCIKKDRLNYGIYTI